MALDQTDTEIHKKILDKLAAYMAIKRDRIADDAGKKNCVLPFNTTEGVCSALVSYWLYSMRIGEYAIYESELEYVLDWDAQKFVESNATDDPFLEHFLNIVAFLQHDIVLRPGVQQEDLNVSFDLLLYDEYPSVAPAEFASTFVFTQESLTELLQKILLPNKMIRVSDSFHTVGLINHDNKLYFYEPMSAPLKLAKIDFLAGAIMYCLPDEKNSESAALHVTVTDLVGANTPEYPDKLALYNNWVADPQYKKALLNNDFIFHLAARKSDYTTIEFILAQGYEYRPCTKLQNTEIVEAIVTHRPKTLAYLISKGLQPFTNLQKDALAPLGLAIKEDSWPMVCILLEAQVSPNIELTKDFSALQYAIAKNNPNTKIISLLIGSGANITAKEKDKLKKKFSEDLVAKIFNTAVQINHQLLNIPDNFILNTANSSQLINFLQHVKFALQLLDSLDNISLIYNGKTYNGINVLQKVAKHYAILQSDDLLSLTQKSQIHELLESVQVNGFKFHKFYDLANVFDKVVTSLQKQPLSQHSLQDLQELQILLVNFNNFLTKHTSSVWHPAESYAVNRCKIAKNKITTYLTNNGVENLEQYLNTLQQKTATPRPGMYFAKQVNETTPIQFSRVQNILNSPNLTI